MKTMKNLMTCGLVIASVTACKNLPINTQELTKLYDAGAKVREANNITPEQEVQFGENMSAVLLGAGGLHSSSKLNQYVNKVGGVLASNSSRPELDWKFGVIDTNSVNAFAAPGGFVFVTSGMINLLENEAELAAVLSHEIAHVTEKHHLEALKSGSMRNLISETTFLAADRYAQNSNSRASEIASSEWTEKVVGAAHGLYAKGLDRDDEFDADKKGFKLLVRSGYDGYAYLSVLQKLSMFAANDDEMQLLFATHPNPEDRLKKVGKQIDKIEELGSVAVLTSRFRQNVK